MLELVAVSMRGSSQWQIQGTRLAAVAACSWTDGAFMHFALYPSREPRRPVTRSVQVGFHVGDFDAAHARILGAGTVIVQEPRNEPWGRTARYLDPDDNIVSIAES